MRRYARILCLILALVTVFAIASCDKDTEGTASNGGADSSAVKLYVKYNNVTVKLGEKADGIIESLGEPRSRTEIGDCGGLGAQVKYSYPSVDIYVLESKDGNVIDQITLRDDTLGTPEGVYIGTSADEARTLLGEPTKSDSSSLQYTSGKYTLKLGIEDGSISGIDYITVS